MNYYQNKTHLSTSFLKTVLNPNREFPESDALEFGQMVDTLLSEYQPLLMADMTCTTAESLGVTDEALELAKVYVRNNKLPQTPKSRYQWEIYKTLRIHKYLPKGKFRGKLDHWLPGLMVEDYKTSRKVPTSKSGLETLISHFDYDMQGAMYCKLTGEETFYFSFLCRTKMTLTQVELTNTMFYNGYMKLINAYKIWLDQNA